MYPTIQFSSVAQSCLTLCDPMNHSFFIHSSVDGHLGYFHVLVIVNSAAIGDTRVFFNFGFLRVYA